MRAAWWVLVALPLMGVPLEAGAQQRAAPYFDYFVSRFRPAWDQPAEQGAAGGRLMWALPAARWGDGFPPVLVGGYLAADGDASDGTEQFRYGAQTDIWLTPDPWVGRVRPFVSLGVGAVREQREPQVLISTPYVAPLGEVTEGFDIPELRVVIPATGRTNLSLAPGVGIRVRLLPGADLRGDARQIFDLTDPGVRRNLEFSAGLSVRAG